MCVEAVTLALCAPTKAPSLSFTCGKLHMLAKDRTICADAQGTCVCYFGTCGTVLRDVPVDGVDMADIKKVRCARCTGPEDATGDRRRGKEILESRLLQRPAIDPTNVEACRKNHATLVDLWGGEKECPYHEAAKSVIKRDEPVLKNGTTGTISPEKMKLAQAPTLALEPIKTGQATKPAIENGLQAKMGIKASHWANAEEPKKLKKHQYAERLKDFGSSRPKHYMYEDPAKPLEWYMPNPGPKLASCPTDKAASKQVEDELSGAKAFLAGVQSTV